jgi:hypothetical protein
MAIEILCASFVLGFYLSLACLGRCIPILIPYLLTKPLSAKSGLYTGTLFVTGRLAFYLPAGLVAHQLGISLVYIFSTVWLKYALILIGLISSAYGLFIVLQYKYKSKPLLSRYRKLVCAFRFLAPHKSKSFLIVVFGLLFASLLCPPFLLLLAQIVIYQDLVITVVATMIFWLTSSILILVSSIFIGGLGKDWAIIKNPERLRQICGIVLIFVGLIFIFRGIMA